MFLKHDHFTNRKGLSVILEHEPNLTDELTGVEPLYHWEDRLECLLRRTRPPEGAGMS